MKSLFIKVFIVLLLLGYAMLLSGCAKTATETIIDNHIDHYNQVIDYANNNMEDTPDTRYLKSELKNCVMTLSDVKETHRSNISTYEAEKQKWQIISLGLFILLCVGVFAKIKRVI